MTETQFVLLASLGGAVIGGLLALAGALWWLRRSGWRAPAAPAAAGRKAPTAPSRAEPSGEPARPAPAARADPRTEPAGRPAPVERWTGAAPPPPQTLAPPSPGEVERSKARGRALIAEGRLEEGLFYFRQAQQMAAEEIEHVIGQCFPHGAPVGTGPALQRLLTRLDGLPASRQLLESSDPLLDEETMEDGVRGKVALRLRSLAGHAVADQTQPADLTTLLRAVADYSLTVATQEEVHEALLERELEQAGRRLERYLGGAGLDGP